MVDERLSWNVFFEVSGRRHLVNVALRDRDHRSVKGGLRNSLCSQGSRNNTRRAVLASAIARRHMGHHASGPMG